MAAEGGESLESLLNKATNPGSREEDWDSVLGFCDQINKELEGPQIAVRLLAHKIQSPQEREALFALSTLEACVKNCGKRFHQEIGKFRFLNEIIKVVSPKYLGNHTTDGVKKKCIEILFSWSEAIKHEPKIYEAYQMLKKQGIVTEDPQHVDTETLKKHIKTIKSVTFVTPPEPPREERKALFEDEEKSKLLARLLKSKHPDDLQAANRLIKNMVKQDAERMEKVSRRVQQIDTVNNSLKLLTEMLNHYNPQSATESETDVMKELYDNLEKQRPTLFRLASDTDDKDTEGFNAILKCNDEVLKVMTEYKRVMEGKTLENGSLIAMEEQNKASGPALVDLGMEMSAPLAIPAPLLPAPAPASPRHSAPLPSAATSSLLDDQLLLLGDDRPTSSILNDQLLEMGLGTSPQTSAISTNAVSAENTGRSDMDELGDLFSAPAAATVAATATSNNSLLDLGLLQQQPQTVTAAPPPQPSFPSFALPQPGSSLPAPPSKPTTNLPAPPTFVSPAQPAFSQATSFQTHTQAPFTSPAPSFISPPASQPSLLSSSTAATAGPTGAITSSNASVLDEPLLPSTAPTLQQQQKQQQQQQAAASSTQPTRSAPFQELDTLGQSLLQQSLSSDKKFTPIQSGPAAKVPMNQMTKPASVATPPSSVTASPAKTDVLPLTDVSVPLETIQPGSETPLTPYDKNNIKVVLHFGKERPRPDVAVVVVSAMSSNTAPVKGFSFQAAVPKTMKVKLQPPSATDLPAYNPILPPSAITQVMLIANPHKEKIRLKYKVSYSLDTATTTDVGDVDNFPFV